MIFEILTLVELFGSNETKLGAETFFLSLAPYSVKLLVSFGKWRNWGFCSSIQTNKDHMERLWIIPSLRYKLRPCVTNFFSLRP